MTRVTRIILGLAAAGMIAGCVPRPTAENERFLVYFDPTSAAITPQAEGVIADAAAKATAAHATAIRIEGRASATGSPAANQQLSQTRVQVVADTLKKDGIDPAKFRQVYVGETGSGDPTVADRRVDIVLEH